MKKILMLIILVCTIGCNNEKKKNKTPVKFHERYKGTPVYKAALAVNADDHVKLIKLLKGKPDSIINYKDSYTQSTLLYYAVQNKKFNSAKTLLSLKADPNIICSNGTSTPFIKACGIPKENKFALLLLNNGGDVNSKIEIQKAVYARSPLIAAVKYNSRLVKILIENGADVNYSYSGSFYVTNVLNEAIKYKQISTIEYLLLNSQVDCTIPRYVKKDSLNNVIKKGTVLEALQNKKGMRFFRDSIKKKEVLKRVLEIIESRVQVKK